MSEERPTPDAAQGDAADEAPYETPAPDADAWAKACAEDLEAEKARRRSRYGPPPGSAAEELRKLVDAVSDKLSSLQSPLLAAAGNELLAAYRSAVESQERRWATRDRGEGTGSGERIDLD